ncbi:MAG: hypothetical protein ABSA65_10560 [Acidimicrobiales bacterium]
MTLSAALDETYHVSALTLGAAHGAEEAHSRAGGNGLDVARVLGGARVAVPTTDLAARSAVHQIEQS